MLYNPHLGLINVPPYVFVSLKTTFSHPLTRFPWQNMKGMGAC